MPSMNQKVSNFLYEQQEYITTDCINAMSTLHQRGPTNITFLGEIIKVKQHKMTPIISVIEAFGFVELYKAGQSKEYVLTEFGVQYLKLIDKLPKEENIVETKVTETPTPYTVEPTTNESLLELLSRILRLISLGKRNSIEEIAETTQTEKKELKNILQHLSLTEMVENEFKNKVRRYQLTELGQSFYFFLKGKENEEEVITLIKESTPRLYDSLLSLKNGQILHKDEVEYAETLGLAFSNEKGTFLTEQGQQLVESKKA